jgi:hypothetical protein
MYAELPCKEILLVVHSAGLQRINPDYTELWLCCIAVKSSVLQGMIACVDIKRLVGV